MGADRQRLKFIEVTLDVLDAGARPVSAKQRLVSDLIQPREILQQSFGRNPADVQIDIGVTPQKKESRIHPQWAAAMGQQYFELRKIDGNVVNINRIAIFIPRAGKNLKSRCGTLRGFHWPRPPGR